MIELQVEKLQRQVRLLRVCTSILTVVVLALFLQALRPRGDNSPILRARGLVIEDEAGRERILLGAPIPAARVRVRTDPARVRKIWGPRFPKEYLDYYKEYRHDLNGMLVLDEDGFDRIAVGNPVPDPNIGKRISPSTGIAINDDQGFERTGYGVLKVDGLYRVNLGLDDAEGSEGLILGLQDGGSVGLAVHHGKGLLFLGKAPAQDAMTGLPQPFHGLLLKEGGEVKRVIDTTSPD